MIRWTRLPCSANPVAAIAPTSVLPSPVAIWITSPSSRRSTAWFCTSNGVMPRVRWEATDNPAKKRGLSAMAPSRTVEATAEASEASSRSESSSINPCASATTAFDFLLLRSVVEPMAFQNQSNLPIRAKNNANVPNSWCDD